MGHIQCVGIHGLGKTGSTPSPVAGAQVAAPPRASSAAPRAALADTLGAAPPSLGGAVRAPSGAVAIPAVGGRPKADTFESQWKQLEATFASAKPDTLEAAIGALGALGFTVASAKSDRAKLRRGSFELKLEAESLGAQPALRMELEGPEKAGAKGGKKTERDAVVVGGALIPEKLYARMEDKLEDVLSTFDKALEAHGKKPLPTTFDQLKAFIDGAKTGKAKAKDAVEDAQVEAQLDALTSKLVAMQAAGTAPRNIVVYTDGPDGAGKSSTGAIVLQAISKAGYATDAVSFKAPTAAEREQHWLQRFRDRGVPDGEQTARFWDRGPAGDAVYGPKTPAQVKEMAKELRGLERELADDGVLLFKVHIFADQAKQAETFGKRFARQAAADRIEAALEDRGALTDASRAALDNIRSKVDGDDLRALVGFDAFQAKFLRFSQAADYHVVDASDRHAARLTIIDALSTELDAFSA